MFATAQQWVSRLDAAQERNQLEAELRQHQNLLGQTALELDRSENRILFNRQRADELAIRTSTGDVTTVKLVQPFHLYHRVPGDLSHIKDTSFVGVTSVKQSDGTERASAIGILPEEMRGVGEGSYMMKQSADSARMTNGTASQSRMSNGSAKRTDATTLTVEYQGGVQTITVPAP